MRAVQITDLSGPDSALQLADVPEPEPSHLLTPGRGVVVDVRAAGVSFPELLQTRGEYQLKPPLPFVPGSEVAGIVRSAPADSGAGPTWPSPRTTWSSRCPRRSTSPRARG
jgi:NADPH2:quinone reductase